MSKSKSENGVIIETLINIFTVEKGNLKILLQRKKEDPYKGYWILPGKIINNETTLEESVDETLKEVIGTFNIYIEQDYTFSNINRNPGNRVVATSYIGLIDSKIVEIMKNNDETEISWFTIDEIPKMAFDHREILDKSLQKLKTKLTNSIVLKQLFPSDFTLPELQSVFESIMNKKLDRRNFRKKFLNLNLIEETGYNSTSGSGRPAKLYRFKENIKEINLF